MKAFRFSRIGEPTDVAEIVEVPEPGDLQQDEAIVAVQASPINHSDLRFIRGQYGEKPALPSSSGGEGAGIVVSVGPNTTAFKPGDKVVIFSPGRNKWVQQIKVKVTDLFRVPEHADIQQVAMLRVNPATAWIMLKELIVLDKGDWVIQNAASSNVGRCVIMLAHSQGIRTVNIVRNQSDSAELKALGADIIMQDSPSLEDEVKEAVGGAPIRLGLDAVSGEQSLRLVQCLAERALFLSYGNLSGQPIHLNPTDIIFRQVSVQGFWFQRWLAAHPERKNEIYEHLSNLVVNGQLRMPIANTFPLEKVQEALTLAEQKGKVLLLPNPS